MTRLRIVFFSIFISILLFGTARPAAAFSFGEMVQGVKDFFSSLVKNDKPKNLTVLGDVTVAEDGSEVEFHYVITNPTKQKHKLSTLNTNIPRERLNYIHDVTGVTSLMDANGTITIPNLLVPAQGEVVIDFKARVNYSPDMVDIYTEPELVDQDK